MVFHDAYDVITKTNDDLKLDESEEVFTYLLCAMHLIAVFDDGRDGGLDDAAKGVVFLRGGPLRTAAKRRLDTRKPSRKTTRKRRKSNFLKRLPP